MKLTRSNKILLTLGSLGVAATIAGAGTFAAFTDTESRTQQVSAGTVDITVGPSATTLGTAISNLAPGDSVQKRFTLDNDGSLDLDNVTLNAVTVGTTSELFSGTPTAAEALQVKIERCDDWDDSGPTLTCVDADVVLAETMAVGANGVLQSLDLASGDSNDLVATFSLPEDADNDAQGDSGVLTFTFVGTQRDGVDS